MPWHIEHDHPGCDGFAVVKDADGSVEGCHSSEAAAQDQVAALYANEPMMSAEPAELAEAQHRTLDLDEPLRTLDVGKRILGLKLLTYNTVVNSKYGPLMFEPGAFGEVDPANVRLRMDHEDPPTGLGTSFKDTPTAPLMDFRVSKTERGNDQLTLAVDGVSRGVSVGFDDVPGKPRFRDIAGKRVLVYPPASAVLAEVSTTWAPTFPQPMAGVMYALSQGEKGTGPAMAEATEAPASGAGIDYEKLGEVMGKALASQASTTERDAKLDKVLDAFEQNLELQRAQYTVPQGPARKPKLSSWVTYALKRFAGETISATQVKELALDDVVTTEQPGLVPNILKPDYTDIIVRNRPFLESTREVTPPATGTSMVLPFLKSRAVAGTQAGPAEKGALTTTAPKWSTGSFAYAAVFSGADISIQMIQRADASFLDLLTSEFGEAYAYDCDLKAVTALLAGFTDAGSTPHAIVDGGLMDPEDPHFGDAWQTCITAYREAPDTIWLSSDAVGAFIDAKAPLTNAPLYSNLAASFTAGTGVGGVLSGLRPIYVPALDALGVDVIIGPSRGFVWAEDPALRLDVPAPSVAGRDIALVGGIFPAPRYVEAFTKYTVTS